MATVNSVRGPLDTNQLGVTLMHEHICSTSAGFWQAWPDFFGGREKFIEGVSQTLAEAKAGGVDTFVDLTTIDLGRDIRLMAEVAERSGMNVIACTGHWLDPSRSMEERTVEELTGLFTREIEQGIEGTDIKAGIIKVATDEPGVTDFIEKVLRAAARAHKATGAPITTHTAAKLRLGERQARIFEQEGVDPTRVYIGHSDDSDSVNYLSGLAERGYWIGLDRLPLGVFYPPPSVEERVDVAKALIDRGHAGKICFSHDTPLTMTLLPTATQAKFNARLPIEGILFVNKVFLPALKDKGVSDDTLRQIMVDNPRRYFEGS